MAERAHEGAGTAEAGPDEDVAGAEVAPAGPADPGAQNPAGVLDLGSLRLRLPDGVREQGAEADGDPPGTVQLAAPSGHLSLSVLAAPRSTSLWSEMAEEIAAAQRNEGAHVFAEQGEWGPEVQAHSDGELSWFIGRDGPGWMLYGVATGPIDGSSGLAAALRETLRDSEVHRGSRPMPVRTALPLTRSGPAGAPTAQAAPEAKPPARGTWFKLGATPASSAAAGRAQPAVARVVRASDVTPGPATPHDSSGRPESEQLELGLPDPASDPRAEEQPAEEQPAEEQPAEEQPAGEQGVVEQGVVEQEAEGAGPRGPGGDQPAGERAAAPRPMRRAPGRGTVRRANPASPATQPGNPTEAAAASWQAAYHGGGVPSVSEPDEDRPVAGQSSEAPAPEAPRPRARLRVLPSPSTGKNPAPAPQPAQATPGGQGERGVPQNQGAQQPQGARGEPAGRADQRPAPGRPGRDVEGGNGPGDPPGERSPAEMLGKHDGTSSADVRRRLRRGRSPVLSAGIAGLVLLFGGAALVVFALKVGQAGDHPVGEVSAGARSEPAAPQPPGRAGPLPAGPPALSPPPGAQVPGAQVPGAQVPGAQSPGAQVPGAQSPGAQVPGAQSPGAQSPGAQVPGAQVPGAQVPGAQSPGVQVPGAQVPGAQVPAPGERLPSGQPPAGPRSRAQAPGHPPSGQENGTARIAGHRDTEGQHNTASNDGTAAGTGSGSAAHPDNQGTGGRSVGAGSGSHPRDANSDAGDGNSDQGSDQGSDDGSDEDGDGGGPRRADTTGNGLGSGLLGGLYGSLDQTLLGG